MATYECEAPTVIFLEVIACDRRNQYGMGVAGVSQQSFKQTGFVYIAYRPRLIRLL